MKTQLPKKSFYAEINRTCITGRKLFKKYNTKYLFMLNVFLNDGIDIRTAIWLCYDRLEVTNA
jgi:hypothetical protein